MNLGAVPLLARRATRDARTPFVRKLAARLTRGATGELAAARLLAGVQARVRFVRDASERYGVDTFTPAKTTWLRGYGDCDDSAPLLAALGLASGLPAELVAMSPDGDPDPSHVAAKLAGIWTETTLRARVGEHPYAAARRLGVLRARDDLRGVRTRLGSLGAMAAARHQWAREMLQQAWMVVRGRPPSLFEIQCAQAWSLHDASYGLGWGPACAGSHNWGAIHAQAGQPSCPYQDRFPDGTVYTQPMRTWPTDEEGAEAFIRQLSSPARPLTQAALARGRSVRDVLDAMRRENYFGGFCPEAAKEYGGQAVRGKPGSSDAADACHEEALDGSQGALLKNGHYLVGFREMTAALGEPMPPLRNGDPRDPAYGSSGGGGLLLVAALAAGGGYYAYKKGWLS
ncbi:MAG: hypothetical protein HOV80_22060 [Polyangiaceae bacterium]|nr:hypothetical protein [Polyangiaceae bacterium]